VDGPSAPPLIVVLGPTASGKTAVAVELATQIDGEIVSADSRAFFRGLDVITDKPSLDQRRGVPHHLIDCVPLGGDYDAMAFRSDVARLLPQIRSRGRHPLLVGGGTLYLGSILRGVFEGPSKDLVVRQRLTEQPADALIQELRSVDPAAAERIHPHDRLRLLRALEVYHLTGVPISRWQAQAKPLSERMHVVGLLRERSEHRALIEQRVRHMVQRGVIEEVRTLLESGLADHMQAYRTIGIPEAVQVLRGELTIDAFCERVAHRTWQLAKRQTAWFRRDQNVQWISVTGRSTRSVVGEIRERLSIPTDPHGASS
jgi:tRNA dimethylallyltransferase